MAPNTKLERIVQFANPFDQDVYKLKANLEEQPSAVYYQGSSGQQELPDEEEDEPSFRITTRARITYELDRFNRNEMLIIINANTDPGQIAYLMVTFALRKFNFTLIETELKDANEISQNIYQFFQKDFSNIGIAAVVTSLSSPGPNGLTTNLVEEWDVLNYFMANQPATLHGRPKIFISTSPEPRHLREIKSLPSDTLLLQAKQMVQESSTRPINLFCSELNALEGPRDLLDIVSEVSDVARRVYRMTSSPIKCLSTMSKELLLEKKAHDHTDSQWKEDFMSAIASNPDLLQFYTRFAQS